MSIRAWASFAAVSVLWGIPYLLGMALLGERPGSRGIAGLALILVGSWLSTGERPPAVPKAVECLASSSDAPG